jgi:hypothetical protein
MPTVDDTEYMHNLPWGHRYCPNCSSTLQVRRESVRFFARYEGDAILFMLCDICIRKYDQLSQKHRQIFQNDCLQTIQHGSLPRDMWACTTYLAVNMNLGDYAGAVEYGIHAMDRTTYEALIRADEACLFINGAPIPWQPFPQQASVRSAHHVPPTQSNEGISK